MEIRFLYFEDCPNWRVARDRLDQVLAEMSDPPAVRMVAVATPEDAERLGFRGSPSIQVYDRDLFAAGEGGVGLSCRVYETTDGPQGSPTTAQLRAALEAAAMGGS